MFERSIARFAAARVASSRAPGAGARVGPLKLTTVAEPHLPGSDWTRIEPLLAGICGSDLATVDGRSSRYFEPIVSFPFVPGHEVVARTEDGGRVVVEPVLSCAPRGIDPPCPACAGGDIDKCERIAFGALEPGLQSGFCCDTGGGWGTAMVAHATQLHPVPDALTDEDAVMVEPAACAIHGAALAMLASPATVAVIGAGTLGLLAIASLRHFWGGADTFGVPRILAAAKHPEQRRWALELGADVVAEPDGLQRAVRRATGSLQFGGQLSGGAEAVIDCVGSAASIEQALSMVCPGGTVVLVGMPGRVSVDLTSLWQRQVDLIGSYAYGTEWSLDERRTFDLAFELVGVHRLGRLVTQTYPIARYAEAIEHAANAGRRGAVKIAFDHRPRDHRGPA